MAACPALDTLVACNLLNELDGILSAQVACVVGQGYLKSSWACFQFCWMTAGKAFSF
jgi:hypothetical protein